MMNLSTADLGTIDRYDDGMSVDYALLLRMWSSFDRSLTRFNRECGVIKPLKDAGNRSKKAVEKRPE